MASSVNVVRSCAAFAAEGHSVVLVHCRGTGNISARYGVPRNFRCVPVPVQPQQKGAVQLLGWTAAAIARRRGAIVYSRSAALTLPASRLGCEVALELHAPVEPEGTRTRKAFAELLRRGRLRAIICISQALADEVAREWPQASRLFTVAHDAADIPASFPSRAKKVKRPLLGYSGHLYPGKGMETIAELAQNRPDWDFLVIGGRPQDVASWRTATSSLANVQFTGMIPHAEVPARLSSADVLLAPYGTNVIVSDMKSDVARWMSPLKLFEYMALGKPIVVSDLPVIREVVRDGEIGRLAAAGDTRDWERVVSEVLADPKAAAAMGKRARREVERQYNWRARARAIGAALGQ
jgi:glycosyltransferase involved in cell wall biosynthesis